MTAQLILPKPLVERMTLDDQAYAEELTAYQAASNALGSRTPYRGEAQWIEHDYCWELRVD